MTSAWILIVGMLIAGVCNTILNKLQDNQCVAHCDDSDLSKHEYFEQPVWQTLNMFVGETFCIIVFYIGHLLSKRTAATAHRPVSQSHSYGAVPSTVDEFEAAAVVDTVENARHRKLERDAIPLEGWNMLLFWLPTLCDLTATTLMNVGLIYTAASIYQMLRGFVIIMTAIFSVLFLGRKLRLYQWVSLFIVVVGLVIVGLSSVLFPQKRGSSLIAAFEWENLIGVGLVLLAQVFTATQFVIEEKIMSKFLVDPIMAVGLEGTFGLTTVVAAMPILYYTVGKSHPGSYFDVPAGYHQIISNSTLWSAAIAICFSIAFFNFFGLSITKNMSATVRSLIDTCRTLFIWLVSIYLGWEHFSWLQVLGFTLLVSGTFIFNDACPCYKPPVETEERRPLFDEE